MKDCCKHRVRCFLFHGEPTWAWWIMWFSMLAAISVVAHLIGEATR